ncbi:MAG: hypothetical protein V1822_02775 [Candidatus Micrarchaeota archaeon]
MEIGFPSMGVAALGAGTFFYGMSPMSGTMGAEFMGIGAIVGVAGGAMMIAKGYKSK